LIRIGTKHFRLVAKGKKIHTNKTSTVNTKKRFGYDLNLTGFPAIAYPVEKVLQQQQLQVK
jgi:hypothetical protein